MEPQKISRLPLLLIDWLINWIVFYAVSALFHPYNGGLYVVHVVRYMDCSGFCHYPDTSMKFLPQEMLMCNMKALIFII